MDLHGLVLAGGVGRRLGRPKGELRLEGRSLAQRAAQALAPLCRGVLVSIRPGAANPAPGLPAIEDGGDPGRGPLAGLEAGFRATSTADLLVLACDYPRVDTPTLAGLLSVARPEHDVVLFLDAAGVEHPLVALWRRRVAALLDEQLRDGSLAVRDLLARCRVRRVGPTDLPGTDLGRLLVNVNRPAEWEALRRGD